MCLDGYIGIRGGCLTSTPESGLYINDLPGFTLSRIEGLSNADEPDFAAIWAKVQARAIRNFRTDVIRFLPKDMKIEQLLSSPTAGNSVLTQVAEPASAEYKGWYIVASGSRHLSLVIPRVQFYAVASGTVTFKVFDALDGMELYTLDADMDEGWNYVQLNASAVARGKRVELFVCYNATGVASMRTVTWDDGGAGFDHDCFCEQQGYNYSSARSARIATTGTPAQENLTFGGGYGLIVPYQIRCSIDNFLCENRAVLANALLYKAGIELLIETRMGDEVLNRYTMVPVDEIEKRIVVLETMYNQELSAVLDSVQPTIDGLCFVCKSEINFRASLPG